MNRRYRELHDMAYEFSSRLFTASYEAERIATWAVLNPGAFDDIMDEHLNSLDNAVGAVNYILATILKKAGTRENGREIDVE